MTFRKPSRSLRTPFSRNRDHSDAKRFGRERSRSMKRRDEKRRSLLENLENRQLLAGPNLIGIQPNQGDLLFEGSVLDFSPNELIFRFDDNSVIDSETLDAIRVTRAGEDRVFESASVTSDLGTGGQALFEFRAVQTGSLGNGIVIVLNSSSRVGTSAPIITTNDRVITIDVNSNPLTPTTARDLTTAVNNDPNARSLVEAIQISGPSLQVVGTTVVNGTNLELGGANAAQAVTDFGSNGAVRVRLVSQIPGADGRGIQLQVEQRNFGGQANPVIVVTDQVIRVQLNSFVGAPTTANDLVAALNNNPQASLLVRASVQEGNGATAIGSLPVTYSPVTLSGVSDVVVEPGFIGLGDSSREVVFRFNERLPDDLYQIDILGSGPFALRNQDGEAFQDGIDLTRNFSINLGPQVVAVVPEPIRRNSNGTLSPETGRIEVHFNDDDLNAAQASDPSFYQLIYTRDSVNNTDDVIISPTSVTYSNITNIATLDFSRPLSRIPDPNSPAQFLQGAARLKIGTSEDLPQPPTEVSLQPDPANSIEPGDSFDTAFDLNSQWTVSGADTTRSMTLTTSIYNENRYELDLPGPDVPGTRDIRPDDPTRLTRTVPLDYVRGLADQIDGISVIQYDFVGSWQGDDPNRPGIFEDKTYFNIISETQKQRVRESLTLFSEYLGVNFVEVEGAPTSGSAISIAVGDLYGADERVVSAQGGIAVATRDRSGDGNDDLVVMDFQDFDESIDDQFGGEFFRGSMFAVGQLLGYGYADDLPQPTTQSTNFIFQPGTDNEPAFPSYADIVHGQYLYRPDSTDIDMYRFELDAPGSVSIETIAERLNNPSLLDTQIRLYRADASGSFVEVAQNDDYFSNDSLIRMENLQPGTYMIGVSAKGNNSYDPSIPGTGFGGLSQGDYELRLDFTPNAVNSMTDISQPIPQALDGDADGRPGGTFNYWFEPSDPSNTIYVDKGYVGGFGSVLGSIGNPYREIDQAIAAAGPGDTIRVLGNGGIDGRLETPEDNFSYQIGFTTNGVPLEDGTTLELPRGVNMLIDAGAILKLSRARIGVGSVAPTIDLSDSSLQVLGTPTIVLDNGLPARDATNAIISGNVYFTSINDDTIGRGNQVGFTPDALPGDWGGIDFRGDLDAADETRRNLENEGIFLNHIQLAEMRYGGGAVSIGGPQVVVSPIDMAITRPTIINSLIINSADAAMAATPDTFKETRFTEPIFQGGGLFTPDYERVGPDIHGNRVVDNSINGLFLRLKTRSGSTLETVNVNARFDDTDIPHVITENTVITGTPGGAVIESSAPSALLIRFSELAGAGNVPVGTYAYRITNVSDSGIESAASQPTTRFTTTDTGAIQLLQLPTVPLGSDLVARKLYRATIDPITGEPGPFTLVAQLNASSTSHIDRAAVGTLELIDADSPLRSRLDASLVIDAGTVVKVDGARIEARFGANLIAEGTSANPVVITSLEDQRYGGGGTFDTNDRGTSGELAPGDWGGLYIGHGSTGSFDNAVIAGAGGTTRIQGGFASFNAIEVHQGNLRLANSRVEFNDDGRGFLNGTREGRSDNAPGVVFVRASQPIIVGNEFINNDSAAITVDVNSLNHFEVNDYGRATGELQELDVVGNFGPLVQENSLTNNAINGMFVRGGELVTEGVWDDVNIVHVVTESIEVPNKHIYGGLRLISDARGSLVVKFENGDETAGIVVGGNLLSSANELRDIPDRIGGALQLVGHPDFPVVLTALADDSAGAGFNSVGKPQVDTNNDGIVFGDIDSGTDLLPGADDDGSGSSVPLLPTGPEVNLGNTIDNDVDPSISGSFSATITDGNDVNFPLNAVTFEDASTGQQLIGQNAIFAYNTYLISAGTAIQLSATTITEPANLIADDVVRSRGTYVGPNGNVDWTAISRFDDGVATLYSSVELTSTAALGDIRVVSYLDEDVGTFFDDDLLYTVGTPGDVDFRAYTVDGETRAGFSHGGFYFDDGSNQINATYEGWTADQFNDLELLIQAGNPIFSIPGVIDQVDLPAAADPIFTTVYGPADVTTAFSWIVDPAADTATVTSFLELLAEDPAIAANPFSQVQAGNWNGVVIREGADDRNVRQVAEREPVRTTVFDTNSIPSQSEFLGELAPNEQSGDENQRLGFIIDGAITTKDDVDVFSFVAESGTEVWLDIDRAGLHLDTVVELVDFNGTVLAASNDSILAETDPTAIYVNTNRLDPDAAQPLQIVAERLARQQLTISENVVDGTAGSIIISFSTTTDTVAIDIEDFLADPVAAVSAAVNAVEFSVLAGPVSVSLLPRQERVFDSNGIITRLGDAFVFELEFDADLFVGQDPPGLQASANGVVVPSGSVSAQTQALLLQSQVQDDYSFSPKDAGMRVRLPGETGTENLYHVRVRSSNTRDPKDFITLVDPSKVRDGLTSGRYSLQIRLREGDETAGTQINLADVRFATNGVQVIGQPFHSPLLAEDYEKSTPNDLLADAQPLGFYGVDADAGNANPNLTVPPIEAGPLSSDRLAKSFGGEISALTDVDWFQFEIQYDDLTRDTSPLSLATVFDLDYASNFARADMALYVFNAAGQLIFTGTDSNIADDLPFDVLSNNANDLSRGSAGTEDPFIGSVELFEGTYFVAISNQSQVPISMDQFFNPATNNPLVRLAPISSVDRIATDTATGGGILFDQNSIVDYTLDDVYLYVNTVNGLSIVNPFTGQNYGQVGQFGDEFRDVAFRSNGELFGYTTNGNRPQSDTNWFYHQIDTGNAALSAQLSVGGGITTFHNLNVEANVQILDQTSDDGLDVEGITIREFGGTEVGFLVGDRPLDRTNAAGNNEGLDYYQNILYSFDETSGLILGPTTNRALFAAGAGTSRREVGQIDTLAPANAAATHLGLSDATIVNGFGNSVAGLEDGDTFTIVSGLDVVTFELDQGSTITANGFVFDGDTINIDGTLFEYNSGARLQIDDVAPNGTLVGGEIVTITGSQGQTVSFEFLGLGQPSGTNVPIATLDAQSQPLPQTTIINNFVAEVNANVLDARASIINGEVVFGNIDSINVSGPGVVLVGDPTLINPAAIEIPILETDLPDAIIAKTAAALRSVGIPVSDAGNQLALPRSGVISVANTPGLSLSGALGVAPGNEPVQLLPTDTADVIARRIVEAIDNSILNNVSTSIQGRSIFINGGALSVGAGSNFVAGGIPTGGQVTGVEIVGNELYAVTDNGGLFVVNSFELNTTGDRTIGDYVATATDLVGFQFEGLRAGPNSLEGGRYANTLFGLTSSGQIVAFNTLGQLVPIFSGGRSVINTGINGALGLDFSTLDYNLWHFTNTRGGDPGHSGASSLAFNYEDLDVGDGDPVDGFQGFRPNYDSRAERPDLTTRLDGQGVDRTYNFPGGARGVVRSNTFDLFGYSANDEPVLYFSYFLDTDDGASTDDIGAPVNSDTLRVYVVTEDGTEHIIASNSDRRTGGSLGDEFDDPARFGIYDDDIDVEVQQLFDNTGSWRQARVPLAEFAGMSNLSLKIEFTTAGDTQSGTDSLVAVSGRELVAGGSLVVNGQVFSIDLSPTLSLPSGGSLATLYADPLAKATITLDGQTYVLDDGSRTIDANEIAIDLFALQSGTLEQLTAEDIANAVTEAIRVSVPPDEIVSGFSFSDPEDSLTVLTGRNDLIFEATPLPYDGNATTILGNGRLGSDPSILPVVNLDDVDLLRVEVTAGTEIAVDATYDVNPTLQLAIRFFNDLGAPLASFNDPIAGTVNTIVNYNGPIFIGLSAANNQTYDPRIANSGSNGLGGNYTGSVRIQPARTFNQQGNTIEFVGMQDLSALPTNLFTVSGVGDVDGLPIPISRTMTADEVAVQVRQALADRFSSGDVSRFPLGTNSNSIQLGVLTLNDAGPLVNGASSYGNQFGASAVRGARDNDNEGAFLDDFIIGFAERGESVSGSPVVDTAFIQDTRFAFPVPNDPVSDLVTGTYQVEIRDASEYIATGGGGQFRSFDTNTRLVEGVSLVARSADQLTDGQTFSITDGRSTVDFEFDLVEAGNGVTPGRVRIPFTLQAEEPGTAIVDPITGLDIPGTAVIRPETSTEVALNIISAINQSNVQSVLDVAALPSSGVDAIADNIIDLVGELVIINTDNALEDILRTDLRGDQNRDRGSQGIILIENSRFLLNSGYGIDISHDLSAGVDGTETASTQRYPRNLVELNTESLRPGVVVQSNLFAFNQTGGVQVSGMDATLVQTGRDPSPFERIVNNTFVGGNIVAGIEAPSATFEGVLFDQGLISFADRVVDYSPDAGGAAPAVLHQTPNAALGEPDCMGRGPEPADGQFSVSLGLGGQITLQFTDNLLTGSGDLTPDLVVFETGEIESVLVEISSDGVTFIDVGIVGGLTNMIDIDQFGFGTQNRFSFVRLTDLRQGNTLGASLGADIDAVGAISTVPVDRYTAGGTGINILGNAAPSVLNNIVANSVVGVEADPTNTGIVLGGNSYYRNTDDVTTGLSLGTFAQQLVDTESVFVSPPDLVFSPAAGSSIIDSSIDSLEDRASLAIVRDAVGIPPSPILAPAYDVNGQLRIDDPNVEPPGGLGERVFKDRGAADRGDLTGPRVTLLSPLAPGVGLDAGRATILGAAPQAFEIQLVDGIAPADVVPGVGVDDGSVDSGSLILIKDGIALVEGVDYRFGYNNSTNIIRLTPIAGVWETNSTYVIRMIDASDAIIRAADGVVYRDADQLTVIDSAGERTTFEYEAGIVIEISNSLTAIAADGITFEVFDGSVTRSFELDANNASLPISTPVTIPAAGNATQFAEALANAINADPFLNFTATFADNFVQLTGGTPLSTATSGSSFVDIDGQIGTRTGFGVLVPNEGSGVSSLLTDGQTFIVRRGAINEVVFEFDSNGLISTTGATPVAIPLNPSLDEVADAIVRAIGGAGLGLDPVNLGFGRVFLNGDTNYSLDLSGSVLQQTGLAGEVPTVAIPISIDLEALEIVEVIDQVIADQNLPGISSNIVDVRIFLEGTGGVVGVGAVDSLIVQDQVGNQLQSNQVDGRTELVIFIGSGFDYGDAPSPYTSLMADGGPRHAVDPMLSLGAGVGADSDAELPNADDDDGVTLPPVFQAGFSANIGVFVNNLDAGTASDNPVFLDAWFDWDQDGQFEVAERLRFGTPGTGRTAIFNNTTTSLLVNVPASALNGETFARFRLSESPNLGPIGDASSGEVEDYRIVVSNNPYQNPSNRFDVNNSGAVTPLDALNVINLLARNGGTSINLELNPVSDPQYPDVTGDGNVTPSDALQVINELGRLSSGLSGEGEAVGSTYLTAAPGVLASGPTAVGDFLIVDSMAREEDDTATEEPAAPLMTEPAGKTSIFDSPESMALDSYVEDLAFDTAAIDSDQDSGGEDAVDAFFAELD